jgi:hypothetical protein
MSDDIFAKEEASVFVTAVFKDSAKVLVVPTSIEWTLKDEEGTVINSREDISVTPASSVTILLKGDDLPCDGALERLFIYFNVEYTDDVTPNVPIKEKSLIIVSDSDGID